MLRCLRVLQHITNSVVQHFLVARFNQQRVDTANTFTFTHPLNATPADDLTAVYRWSTDLQEFHDGGDPNGAGTTTVTFLQGPPSGGMVTVTATISGSVIPDKLFVDVAVRQN